VRREVLPREADTSAPRAASRRSAYTSPAMLLEQTYLREQAAIQGESETQVVPAGMALLLDFEEGTGTCQDSSGAGMVPVSTPARYDWSSGDCKRGGNCLRVKPGGAATSYPIKIPCLSVKKDWAFTAWVKTDNPSRSQTMFFIGNRIDTDWIFTCKVEYAVNSKLSCEGPSGFSPTAAGSLVIGDRVKARDKDTDTWKHGEIISMSPIHVKPDGWANSKGFKFNIVVEEGVTGDPTPAPPTPTPTTGDPTPGPATDAAAPTPLPPGDTFSPTAATAAPTPLPPGDTFSPTADSTAADPTAATTITTTTTTTVDWCSGGQRAVGSAGGQEDICCLSTCSTKCGQTDCADATGGEDGCCTSNIESSGTICGATTTGDAVNSAPCKLDTSPLLLETDEAKQPDREELMNEATAEDQPREPEKMSRGQLIAKLKDLQAQVGERSLLQLTEANEEELNKHIEVFEEQLQPVETEWHHFAAVRSASDGSVQLFWDGRLTSTEWFLKGDMPMSANSGMPFELYIGTKLFDDAATTNRNDFDGLMDEVTVWQRSLSAHEVRKIYQQTSAFTGVKLQRIVGRLQLLLDFEDMSSDDVAVDTSGNNFHVKKHATAASWSTNACQRGDGCMSFAGGDQTKPVEIPCLKLRQDWSFTAWLKTTSTTNEQTVFFYGNTYNATYGFTCSVQYSTPTVTCEAPATFATDPIVSTNDIGNPVTDAWHHLSVTRNSVDGVVSIYWDGAQKVSKALGTGNMPENNPGGGTSASVTPYGFSIGGIVGKSNAAWNGVMDEVSVWSRMLTDKEINQIWSGPGPQG